MDSPSIQFCSGFDQTSPVGDMLIHHFIIFLSKYLHNVTKHLKDFTENRYNRPSISAATSIAWSTINNQRWKTGFARSWTRPNVYKIWQLKEKWLNCYSLEGIKFKNLWRIQTIILELPNIFALFKPLFIACNIQKPITIRVKEVTMLRYVRFNSILIDVFVTVCI